ncbi:methyltransferase domain-containing protein [Salegentibacter sp. T436]|jgi:trans-aconitate methyltransferase|uniref:methyltransferase domain-containing protein n=1 Tax=Salegentibacter sp. T436 TaxID=1729720 RepID=UPI00094A90E3|nr:methyltransferase domain-containing protein [Salegentibacter sp. T436]APS40246.1 methyltransferase type 11 [Salegentibacter sp. T436]
MSTLTTKWNPALYNNKHSFVYDYGKELLDLLNPKANERILDLGCGSGQLTYKISELAGETIGIDKSSEMIADAKSKFPSVTFQVGDAENFNFDKKFDAIFSNAALHWVKNHKPAIHCMYENLKENGKIVLEFGGKGNVQTIIHQLRRSLQNRDYIKQSELKLWYFPSVGEYTTELKATGFRILLAEHFDRPTELADKNTGIKDWISMFAENFFAGVAPGDVVEIKEEVQEKVKDKCLVKDKWYADYKRIRIVAVKEKG